MRAGDSIAPRNEVAGPGLTGLRRPDRSFPDAHSCRTRPYVRQRLVLRSAHDRQPAVPVTLDHAGRLYDRPGSRLPATPVRGAPSPTGVARARAWPADGQNAGRVAW
jgi:hypothetical protein